MRKLNLAVMFVLLSLLLGTIGVSSGLAAVPYSDFSIESLGVVQDQKQLNVEEITGQLSLRALYTQRRDDTDF